MKTNPVSINSGNHRARVTSRRDALIVSHLALVGQIARQIRRHLPNVFDLADLIATGNLALTHAAGRYRPREHGGTPFSAYARTVIRGAILTSVYRAGRFEENTRPGIMPWWTSDFSWSQRDDDEARESVDSPPLARVATQPNVVEAIDQRRTRARVAEAIAYLPAPQQKLLEYYYSPPGPTLCEVAGAMGITPRQAQSLHSTAVAALRRQIRRRAV